MCIRDRAAACPQRSQRPANIRRSSAAAKRGNSRRRCRMRLKSPSGMLPVSYTHLAGFNVAERLFRGRVNERAARRQILVSASALHGGCLLYTSLGVLLCLPAMPFAVAYKNRETHPWQARCIVIGLSLIHISSKFPPHTGGCSRQWNHLRFCIYTCPIHRRPLLSAERGSWP